MKLFKKKKKSRVVVDHGKGDVRVYPSAGTQVHMKLQHVKQESMTTHILKEKKH